MQEKTTDVQEITFVAGAKSIEICQLYSLASYLLVRGGNRCTSDAWVFPFLNNVDAAKAIATMLKELPKKVHGLHAEVTATDIRVGSVNDIINAAGTLNFDL